MVSSVLQEISAQKAIPVLRCADATDAVATARACADAGMTAIELTCSTPDVESAIERLTAEDGLSVGLGTITSPGQIRSAVSAGASFVVSFFAPEGFVHAAHDHGVVAIPGAFTPTEVSACRDAGADAVKLFPAMQLTPGYVRDLHAVMPELRLMATGGLKPVGASLCPWLEAGACAVGIGGALGTASTVGAREVTRRARIALDACAVTDPPASAGRNRRA